MQGCILPAMGDKKRMLRQTAGTTIAVIVTQGGLGSWPQLLQAMQCCLESSDPDALDGTLDALYKVKPLHHTSGSRSFVSGPFSSQCKPFMLETAAHLIKA